MFNITFKAGINATVTTITVTDADGVNYLNDTPRFDIGQMIKIGTEYMAIVAVNTSTQALTVIRGIRGSTAAIHANSAAISVFIPEPDITRATTLIAFFDYARRGEKTRATFDGVTVISGMEVPTEVAEILSRFTLLQIGG